MSWIQSIIYGLISGISEFLPISSRAHQEILEYLFGNTTTDPIRLFFIHLATLFALYSSLRTYLDQIRRENSARRDRRRSRVGVKTALDISLVKNAAIVMVIGMFLLTFAFGSEIPMLWTCIMLLCNGLVLFMAERSVKGNKTAKHMSVLDSWLMGILSAFAVLPGISRIGAANSVAIMRGADRQKSINWALLLSIPALVCMLVLDVFAMFAVTTGLGFWANLGGYLLSAVFAYIGASLSLYLVRLMASRSVHMAFAYYAWGAALFTFLIYLVVA